MERLMWMLALGGAILFAYWASLRPPERAVMNRYFQSSFQSRTEPAEAPATPSPANLIKLGANGSGPSYYEDFNAAMASARSERKPVVVVFGADYCGACHHFVEVTCTSSAVEKYYDRVIWVYMNTQKPPSRELRRQHPDKSFNTIPHLWFIRWDGAFIGDEGYMPDPDTFATRLETLLAQLPGAR